MFKCLFLIAVTAPILVYCDEKVNTGNTTNPPELKCHQKDNIKTVLTKFQVILQNSIQESLATHSNNNVNATITPAANEVLEEVVKTCIKNGNVTRNYTDFITLLDFSLKDEKYNNFTSTNGTDCINETRTKIHKCVNDEIGYTNNTEMPVIRKLLRKARLTYSRSTCTQTKYLRTCTEKVLKNNNTHCKDHHVDYVTSLFDFVLQNSQCVNWPTEFKPLNSSSSVICNSAIIMVPFLLTLY